MYCPSFPDAPTMQTLMSRQGCDRSTRLLGPLPRVPDDEQGERALENAQEDVVDVVLADCREQNGGGVDSAEHDVRPAVEAWFQDQGENDHQSWKCDVDRDGHQEHLVDLEGKHFPCHDVLDESRAEV